MKYNKGIELPPKFLLIAMTALCIILSIVTYFFRDSLSFLNVITNHTIVPMQNGVTSVSIWIEGKFETLQDIRSLISENEELKQQVDELTYANKIYQEDQYELNRLRDLLELDEKYSDYDKIGARVIAADSNNWFNTFVIDKGSNDGIEVDMNVIAGNGLVGIVTDVSPDYSTVKAITDDTSYVYAMFINTNDLCVVKGDTKEIIDGYINVTNIPKDAEISEGDELVTSHISNKFLEGITIGYVTEITIDSNNLTKTAKLTPVVDFKNLQEVLVITQKKQSVE